MKLTFLKWLIIINNFYVELCYMKRHLELVEKLLTINIQKRFDRLNVTISSIKVKVPTNQIPSKYLSV